MEEGSQSQGKAKTENHLSEEQTRQLCELLERYEDILSSLAGRTVLTKHKINLKENAKPHRSQPYRLSPKNQNG